MPEQTETIDTILAQPKRYADVTGVILAGGRSRRMGRDKATLEVAGVPLFERVLTVLRQFFPHIIIAGDRPDLASPGVVCYPDLYPGSALGGLYTGLYRATTPAIFAVACDLPYLRPELVQTILEHRRGQDVVVPQTASGWEPLCALYGKSCLEPMRLLLEQRNYRIYDFYPQVRVCSLGPEALPPGWQRALLNLNTPEELQRLQR